MLANYFGRSSQVGVAARVENHNMAVAEAEKAFKEIQEQIFTSVLDNIVNFVATAASLPKSVIPAAVFLTGVRTNNFHIVLDLTLSTNNRSTCQTTPASILYFCPS